jgi:predicted RNA-binding protein with PUA-like domain
MATQHWLVKSEPDVYAIDDLARDRQTGWEGVRNYTARIHLRAMALGDEVLFYHSNAQPSGVAGRARVARTAYPDLHARDPTSPYHDPDDTAEEPRWSMVDVAFVAKLPRVVTLAELKAEAALEGMEVTKRGSRLSVTPVTAEHFAHVLAMAERPAPVAETGGGAAKPTRPAKPTKSTEAARAAEPARSARVGRPEKPSNSAKPATTARLTKPSRTTRASKPRPPTQPTRAR